MPFSDSSPASYQWFSRLAAALDRTSGCRLALVLVGAFLARGWRTVTSWIPAADLNAGYNLVFTTVAVAGKRGDAIAAWLAWEVAKLPPATGGRLSFAPDDTPTPRYGPQVQGPASTLARPLARPAIPNGHIRVVLRLPIGHPLLAKIYLAAEEPGLHQLAASAAIPN